jgi:Domain of unknown function (DUF4157)/Lysine-specific metallo-endopeptidase
LQERAYQNKASSRRGTIAGGTCYTWLAKPLQCKLRVGAVDDPLEREADGIAEQIARAPDLSLQGASSSDATLRRKCACGRSSQGTDECEECKKKHEGRVQRAATQTSGPCVAPAIVHEVLKSSGRPLGSEGRAFFESRFGHDFSRIRVHADARAAESARSLNALAYAVGNDIVFDTGRYAPETAVGRKLLAHEIAHVVQQNGADVIRRATPPTPSPLPAAVPAPGPGDFEITRVEGSTTDEIFFAKNSSTLSSDALTQIASIKSSAPTGVKLLGFSSADETATVAQERANKVKAELVKSPGAVAVNSAVGSAAAQVGQANFPSVRKVEVVVGSAAPKTLNCKAKDAAGKLINPPKQSCTVMDPATQTAFNSALTIANDAMTRASAAVASSPSAADAAIIDQFFGNHDAGTLSTLKTNLGNLKTHVAGLPGITSCGGQCDSGGCDGGSTIAYNQGVDAASSMTLCVPTFKSLANDNDRARNLMHESAHGTSPLGGASGTGTADVAYRHERIIFQLSPADRLRNSDSYALFALFLRERQMTGDPAAVPAGIQTPASDIITGFSVASELAAVKTTLAQLEKRLSWAADWMGQLYGQIVAVRAGTLSWATSWAGPLMTEVSKRFPLTAPPATPTLTDQTREAGILDRYRRMKSAVKRDLTITRMAAGVVTWPAGGALLAAKSLQIGPDFFTATPADQISLLLESLAGSTPDVEAAFIPAYVSLAAWIHSQNP